MNGIAVNYTIHLQDTPLYSIRFPISVYALAPKAAYNEVSKQNLMKNLILVFSFIKTRTVIESPRAPTTLIS